MEVNRANHGKLMALWRLAHMIIIPIQDISDMEAILNVPMWAVAAIFKIVRHAIYYC